jgi:hypothetical protein
MLKYIVSILVKELVDALYKAFTDYLKLQQKKKEDKKKVDDALKEKDPATRARAIRNLLDD